MTFSALRPATIANSRAGRKSIEYFKKLDAASDRVQFEEIGKTTMTRPFVYATISAPENLKNLEKYKQINAKLADPRLIQKQ